MITQTLLDEIAAGHGLYLSAAARRFPSFRQGRPVSLSCLVRWLRDGVRGQNGERIHLEASRLAGRWITTPQAIVRFLEAQAPKLGGSGRGAPRASGVRQRASEQAGRSCHALASDSRAIRCLRL
jgi:hypothetical protein